MSTKVFSVAGLIAEVNSILEQGFSGVSVEGEVTNVSTSGRGHLYFSLKDENATLDCVMWASRSSRLRFELEDGLAVLAVGSLTIYRQRGRFQLVVDSIQPQGVGALQLAFEQLKRKLEAEGLFATDRKRDMPALPNRIGIVTSSSAAALADMLKVLRRFPFLEVVVAPARVQGEDAAAEIAAAIMHLGEMGEVNIILVSRGGGSLEDLWAFNEEVVARAIAASPVPVITGVGHEVDFTIADFVADIRATTPTQAAELVVSRLEDQDRRLHELRTTLERDLSRHLQLARARLAGLEGSSGLAQLPLKVRSFRERLQRVARLDAILRRVLENAQARLERAERQLRRLPARVAAGGHRRLLVSRLEQLEMLVKNRLANLRQRIKTNTQALTHLGPPKVLARGYSITTLEDSGKPLKNAQTVQSGQALITRLARGELRSLVSSASKPVSPPKTDTIRQPSLFDNNKEPDSKSEK